MELLRAELNYRRGGRNLLKGVSLSLRTGQRLGLVGRNGAGKSTLLDLLAGQLQPSEGRVLRTPGLRLGTLPRLVRGTIWDAGLRALAHVRTL